MTRRSPGTHSTNLYWPVPTGFLATWSPAACTAVGDIMNAFWSAVSVAAKGPSVVNSSVASSRTLTAVIGFRTAASGFLVFGSTNRSRLYLATVALNGEPSWNFTPWRSLKRQVVSLGVSHDVASAGWGASFGSSTTSVSNIAFIMLREKALVVTSGSSDSASTPSTSVASPLAARAGFAAGAATVAGTAGAGGLQALSRPAPR